MVKPFEPYKIDQQFGSPTSYGPHEGWDMNGLGGGNTDCGTLLKAVGDGEVVHISESTKDYGKLLVLYCKTSQGDRWIRYCHLQETSLLAGKVKEGQVIAKMGSTGNSTACHLHFDVLKKQPSNWRFFAKTQAELLEWYENPSEFFNLTVVSNTTPEPEVVLTNTPKIDLDSYGVMERQAIISSLADKDKEIRILKQDIETMGKEIQKLKNPSHSTGPVTPPPVPVVVEVPTHPLEVVTEDQTEDIHLYPSQDTISSPGSVARLIAWIRGLFSGTNAGKN